MGHRQLFPVQMELEGSQEQCNEQVMFAGATAGALAPGARAVSPASRN